MIFIALPSNNCFVNDIHSSLAAHNCVIVIGSIKGAAPPAFNRTLERVEHKQASRNSPLQATFKQAAFYTQLSKPTLPASIPSQQASFKIKAYSSAQHTDISICYYID